MRKEKPKIPLNKYPDLEEIKKIQKDLKTDIPYQGIQSFYHLVEEANSILQQFQSKLQSYYLSLEMMLTGSTSTLRPDKSQTIKRVSKQFYFLFDDFQVADYLKDKGNDGLSDIIYSPFSVNFFSRSFIGFNKYLRGNKTIPQSQEQLNELLQEINNDIIKNFNICPLYLQQIFTQGIILNGERILGNDVFENIVLEKMFSNPHLFNLLDFSQPLNASQDDINRLKKSLKGQFSIDILLEEIKPLTFIPSEFKKYKNRCRGFKLEEPLLQYFRRLIHRGNDIPDEFTEELPKLYYDQLMKVLYNEDEITKKLFNALKAYLTDKKKVTYFQQGVKTIRFELALEKLQSAINKVLNTIEGHALTIEFSKQKNDAYIDYINDPFKFFNDITEEYKNRNVEDEKDKGNDSIIYSLAQTTITGINTQATNSDSTEETTETIETLKSDPTFLHTVMLNGMTLKNFIANRPGLKIADQTLLNKMIGNKNLEEYRYEELIKMYKEDRSKWTEILSVFMEPFVAANQTPYDMLKSISRGYNSALNLMKSYLYPHNDSASDEMLSGFVGMNNPEAESELIEKFIVTLFDLARPPTLFSTYVYLYEYVLSPKYKNGIFKGVRKKHIQKVDFLFKTFLPKLNSEANMYEDAYSYYDFIRLNNLYIDLRLKSDIDLDKLAEIIALSKQSEKNIKFMLKWNRENNCKDFVFKFYTKSVFTTNSRSRDDDDGGEEDDADDADDADDREEPCVWNCRVIGFDDKYYDKLPLNNAQRLMFFLEEEYAGIHNDSWIINE